MSGLSWGSQLSWAALSNEAYASYICLSGRCHFISLMLISLPKVDLPLHLFLDKETLNSKINNWALDSE